MKEISWPYFDPEFENLTEKIFGPSCRVWIDNESCDKCTVVKVDSSNKQGFHLEVVQVLTDMDLYISKCHISSDGRWSIDVFHVRDQLGHKVRDQRVIDYLQQAIGARREFQRSGYVDAYCGSSMLSKSASGCTAIEMIGTDRPGLFSEISAALADLKCDVVEAHAWSHNACLAFVAYISDESNSSCISDPNRLAAIEDHLSAVLHPDGSSGDNRGVRMAFSDCGNSMTDAEHRLHRLLMLASRDFVQGREGHHQNSSSTSVTSPVDHGDEQERRPVVSIESCHQKGYSVVNVDCMDRSKLMFDTVCTLTDMQYVVFHACVTSHGSTTHQEYYIRDAKGCTIDTQHEKEQVAKCLEAAIKRRVCDGVRLELRARSSAGLLPRVTRMLRQYGLTVVRADIETLGEKTVNVFYVRDMTGSEIDMRTLETLRRELQPLAVQVKNESPHRLKPPRRTHVSFGSKLRSQMEKLSHNLISIR